MATTTPTFLEEIYAPTDRPPEVEDLLPNNVPNSRILIFGYNSNVARDVSLQGIKEHADTLLDRFTGIRSEESKTRPIIFIAHSLGGLVIKQALINATNNPHTYGSIKAATYGLVFFGTPHQGGNGTSLGKVAANVVTAVSGNVRNDLIDSLSKNSMLTQNANEDFSHQWEDYRVVSFYETRKTKVKKLSVFRVLNSIVVNAESAKLGLGGRRQTQLAIDADHSGICKFEAADHKYEPIGRHIRDLVDYSIREASSRLQIPGNRPMEDIVLQAPQARRPVEDLYSHAPEIQLSEKEQKCLQGFFLSDYETHRQEISCRHHPGTCEWIFNHPEYLHWSRNEGMPLLWISGNPGMGKSVFASFLLRRLEDSVKNIPSSAKRVIYYFFNDQDKDKKTAISFLRAIIHQLLTFSPSLLKRHVMPSYESLGNRLYDSFGALWKIFLGIASDAEFDGIYCVIDALDECEKVSRVQLLRQLAEFSGSSHEPGRKSGSLKFVLTSRPYDSIQVELSGTPMIRLEAEREDESINTDIKQFVESEVEKLARDRGYNNYLREKVEHTLNEGADGMFLWVVLIIEILKSTPISETEQTMKRLPKKIDDIYIQTLKDMPEFAWKILMWVVYAYRPLKLEELAVACTIKKQYKSFSSIPTDALDGIRGDIKLCGPILKVRKDGSVHLVHQSAKDFLLRPGSVNSASDFLIRNPEPHYEIAVACTRYLSLDGWIDLPKRSLWGDRFGATDLEVCNFFKGHPFFRYAALYWHQHVTQAQGEHLRLWGAVHELLARPQREIYMQAYQYLSGYTPITNQTPLHILSRFGFYFFLQYISQEKESSINSVDDGGRTPLSWGAEGGHAEVVKLLVETQGVDVNPEDGYGRTPLSIAALMGHVEVVKLLVETQGVDVNSKGEDGQTPLFIAALMGHVEVVKRLVETQGVGVGSGGEVGQTPLFMAAIRGHVEVVKLLVGAQGVDVSSKDKYGRTVLSWARHPDIIKILRSFHSQGHQRNQLRSR